MKKYYFTTFLLLVMINGYTQKTQKDYSEAFKLIEIWLDAQKDFEQLPGITAIAVEVQSLILRKISVSWHRKITQSHKGLPALSKKLIPKTQVKKNRFVWLNQLVHHHNSDSRAKCLEDQYDKRHRKTHHS